MVTFTEINHFPALPGSIVKPSVRASGEFETKSVMRAFVYTFHVAHITFRPVSSAGRHLACRFVLP